MTEAPLLQDSHESIDHWQLLQQAAPVERARLNDGDLGDYAWSSPEGLWSWEHKQCGELLQSMDNVEEQLQRQIAAGRATHYGLVVHGVVRPYQQGIQVCQWVESKRGPILVGGRIIHQPYSGYRAFLHGLERAGVQVLEVPSLEACCASLAACYHNDQKLEHDTLLKPIKRKVWLPDAQPQVVALMGLAPGIGLELAEALVGRQVDRETGEIVWQGKFDSIWAVLNAPVGEIASAPLRGSNRHVGPAAARKLLQAIGKGE